jgi:hypothetical protein
MLNWEVDLERYGYLGKARRGVIRRRRVIW